MLVMGADANDKQRTAATPRVSVGLPVYNGERWLADAITSILNQTFTDFELIICDNCSTDRTREIAEAVVARDNRVRYIRNDINIGVAGNHNRTLELARGDFFLWFAYDDLHHPDSLRARVAVLDDRPEVVAVYSSTNLIDEFGTIRPADESEPIDFDIADPVERFALMLSNIPQSEAVYYGLIRRPELAATGGERNCFGGDRCCFAHLALYGRFVKLPEVLFSRRIHADNIANTETVSERFDPARAGRLAFPEWRIVREHLKTILRAPQGLGGRLRLLGKWFTWSASRFRALGWEVKVGMTWLFRRRRRTAPAAPTTNHS